MLPKRCFHATFLVRVNIKSMAIFKNQFFHDYSYLIIEKCLKLILNFTIFFITLIEFSNTEYRSFILTLSVLQIYSLGSAAGIDTRYNFSLSRCSAYRAVFQDYIVIRTTMATVLGVVGCIVYVIFNSANVTTLLTIIFFCWGSASFALETQILMQQKPHELFKITAPLALMFLPIKIFSTINYSSHQLLFMMSIELLLQAILLYNVNKKNYLINGNVKTKKINRSFKILLSYRNIYTFFGEIIIVILQKAFLISAGIFSSLDVIKLAGIIQRAIDLLMLILANYYKLKIKNDHLLILKQAKLTVVWITIGYCALSTFFLVIAKIQISPDHLHLIGLGIINCIFFYCFQLCRFVLNREGNYARFGLIAFGSLLCYVVNLILLHPISNNAYLFFLLPLIFILKKEMSNEKYGKGHWIN